MRAANPATAVNFDETRWPIVVVTLPTRALEGVDFDRYVADLSRYHDRGQAFGCVFDIRNAPTFTAAQRRVIADAMTRQSAKHAKIKFVIAVVIASAIQRGVVKAITWLTPQPAPTGVFGTVEEAVAWAQRSLVSAEPDRTVVPRNGP